MDELNGFKFFSKLDLRFDITKWRCVMKMWKQLPLEKP
jgi:hypothetical protein